MPFTIPCPSPDSRNPAAAIFTSPSTANHAAAKIHTAGNQMIMGKKARLVWTPYIWQCSNMLSFKTMGEVANYFKTQKPGAEVTMTEGPNQTNRKTNQHFKQRGVKVKVTGTYGNRLVTYVGREEQVPEMIKEYKKSKNENPDLTIGVLKERLIEDGPAIYMEGYHANLITRLRKMGYTGRYSVNKHGNGWMVSVRSEDSIKRCQSTQELLDYLSTSKTGTQALLVGVGKRTKSGLTDQFEKAGIKARIDEAPGGFRISRE